MDGGCCMRRDVLGLLEEIRDAASSGQRGGRSGRRGAASSTPTTEGVPGRRGDGRGRSGPGSGQRRGGAMRRWEARRSPRLMGYNYGLAGAYFVTVCTWGREAVLGEVVGSEVGLSAAGRAVAAAWEAVPLRLTGVEIDAFVVMPNHVHGIVVLGGDPEVPLATVSPTLAVVMRVFKSVSGIEGNRALGRTAVLAAELPRSDRAEWAGVGVDPAVHRGESGAVGDGY